MTARFFEVASEIRTGYKRGFVSPAAGKWRRNGQQNEQALQRNHVSVLEGEVVLAALKGNVMLAGLAESILEPHGEPRTCPASERDC